MHADARMFFFVLLGIFLVRFTVASKQNVVAVFEFIGIVPELSKQQR
jgi:hypothetical protein